MNDQDSNTQSQLRVAIGADHRGSDTANFVLETLQELGYEGTVVEGCDKQCDYPEKAYLVGESINSGNADRGVLICGTGIGMSIAANKINGLRAALVHDELTAQLSRAHNDANVLCLSADLLGARLIAKIIEIWMKSDFEGGRHQRRVNKISAIEKELDPQTAGE